MDLLEKELQKAIDAQCYLAGLSLALTIPSVCSHFTSPNEQERTRYPKWCEQYLPDFMDILDGKECYALRCDLLHNGDDTLTQQPVLSHAGNPSYCSNHYHLHVPYSEHVFYLTVEDETDHVTKPFCAAAVIVNMLEGYRRFKEDHPFFVYPMSR